MSDKDTHLDPIGEQMLVNKMQRDALKRRAFTPRMRIRRPWLGVLNWERHKHKMAHKRYIHNRMATQTRTAQRRVARA